MSTEKPDVTAVSENEIRVADAKRTKKNMGKLGNIVILPGEPELQFGKPLKNGPYPIVGKSLEELSSGMALFSPIEGISEESWQPKTCGACHKWTQDSLCKQGEHYGSHEPDNLLRKMHPYGGPFKLALRAWSQAGCQ